MIEIPRAALLADEIAKEADFFSFGTNDLTQMTFGFSVRLWKIPRFIYENKIYQNDPFAKIDQIVLVKLVEMATVLGRKTKPKFKLEYVGEHGVRPKFC
jgi:pyruvate,orthophosphate dikinase